MTVCVWGGVVGGQCLLYMINMHLILLKLRNKKPFFNDCSAHFKIFFFTCNNVMFYHNQSETSEFTTPLAIP